MIDRATFISTVKDEIEKLQHTIVMYKSITNPIAPDNAIGRVSRMDAINNKSVKCCIERSRITFQKIDFYIR